MSLGTSGSSDGTDTVSQAVNRAADAGIIPVIAAGNSGPAKYTIGSPGAAGRAITVAAMADVAEGGFSLAAFSSRGPTKDERIKPEIGAPGVNITSVKANSGNLYISYSGTSMATPFVAGTCALMLSANPTLTLAEVRDLLQSTAQEWGLAGQDIDYGWGRLDGYAAVKKAGNFTTGTAPTVPGHVTFSGTIAAVGGKGEHTFAVTDTSYPLSVTMITPNWVGGSSPDFDLYLFNPDGSELARSTTATRQEQVSKAITKTGTYKISIQSYAGTGPYIADVSAGMSGAVNQPPTLSIPEPAEGATVAGTVAVKVTATDDTGVAKVEVAVDNGPFNDITASFDGTRYTYTWETTLTANGVHSLNVRATDTAGLTSQMSRHVTVANQGSGQNEVTRTGIVTASVKDAIVTITVNQVGYMDLSCGWSTTADLDFYVSAPDGTFVGRAYTLNNPERLRVDTVKYGVGAYKVRVNLYSGPDTTFTLKAKGYRRDTYTGSVSPTSPNATQEWTINYTGTGQVVVGWPGTSDLDLFVTDPTGVERARASSLRNPEKVDVPMDKIGVWRARVNLYRGAATTHTLYVFAPDTVLA